MNKTYFNNQKITAYDNYNYFIMKMIVKVIICTLKLSIMLVISSIFNYLLINIIAIIYTIISIFKVYEIIYNYKYIINDIKNTLDYQSISFEIDLNAITNNIFKGLISYGK